MINYNNILSITLSSMTTLSNIRRSITLKLLRMSMKTEIYVDSLGTRTTYII